MTDVQQKSRSKFAQQKSATKVYVCHQGYVCVCVRTIHEGHLVVFIAMQNLVGIDAVVLIICMFFDFSSLSGKSLFTPPKLGFWGI